MPSHRKNYNRPISVVRPKKARKAQKPNSVEKGLERARQELRQKRTAEENRRLDVLQKEQKNVDKNVCSMRRAHESKKSQLIQNLSNLSNLAKSGLR